MKRIGVQLAGEPAKDRYRNEELIDFIAKILEVPQNALELVSVSI